MDQPIRLREDIDAVLLVDGEEYCAWCWQKVSEIDNFSWHLRLHELGVVDKGK